MLHALYKPTECKTTLFHKCHHLRLWPSCFAFVSHPSATPSPHFSGTKPSFLPGKRQNQRALWSLTSHVLVTPHLLDAVNLFFYPHDIWMQKTCAWLYECVCAWPCSLQFGCGSKKQQLSGEWWFVWGSGTGQHQGTSSISCDTPKITHRSFPEDGAMKAASKKDFEMQSHSRCRVSSFYKYMCVHVQIR